MNENLPKLEGKTIGTYTELREAVEKYSPQTPLDYITVHTCGDSLLNLLKIYIFYGDVNLTPYLLHILDTLKSGEDVKALGLEQWENDIFKPQTFDKLKFKPPEKCCTDINRIKKCLEDIEKPQVSDVNPRRRKLFLDNSAAVFEYLSGKAGEAANKKQLYYAITALYCFIEVSFREHPVSTDGAENGLTPEKYVKQRLLGFKDVFFAKSGAPYPLVTESWKEGETAELKKISNGLNGGSYIEFRLIYGEDNKEGGLIRLYPGQYFYVYVNERGSVVHIPAPVSAKNGRAALRKGLGEQLLVVDARGSAQEAYISPEDKGEMPSAAADGSGGFIAVIDGKICSNYIKNAYLEDAVERITIDKRFEENVADIVIDENGYLYCINTRGQVKTTNPSPNGAGDKIINRELKLSAEIGDKTKVIIEQSPTSEGFRIEKA